MKGLGVSPSSQFGESYGKIKKTAVTTAINSRNCVAICDFQLHCRGYRLYSLD
jgi:hypothetical protein